MKRGVIRFLRPPRRLGIFCFCFCFCFLCLDGSTGSRALAKSENYLVSLCKVRFTKGISLPIYIGASRWMRLSSKIMRV